ncbi:Lysine/arginine/ornithine-binding periplasmic protein [compost metagenome]
MKKTRLTSWMAGAVMLMAGAAGAQAETLRFAMAAEPYPPFSFKQPNGEWAGFEPDLIRALCAQMQAQCELKDVAWDGIIPALLAKKVDVIFNSLSITEEREQQIAFSRAYYGTDVGVAAPKGMTVDISPEGLKDKTIGVQISTVSSNYLKKYYEKIANVRYYETQDQVNADLLAGRLDLMLADASAVSSFIKTPDAQAGGLEFKGNVPHDPLFGRGVGAGLRKEDQQLKAKLDEAIGKLLASEDYKTISARYFDFSVAPRQ